MSKANYDLPDELIKKVMKKAKVNTKKDAIIIALEAYLKRKKIEEMVDSFGKIPTSWTKQTLAQYRGR